MDIKKILGYRAKSIILNGINQKEKNGKICCPVHGEKNPSMAWHNESNCFKCFSRGTTPDIYRYYTDFEHLSFKDAETKVKELIGQNTLVNCVSKTKYDKINISMSELSHEAIENMNTRGISKKTLDYWKVKQSNDRYVFQYFNY